MTLPAAPAVFVIEDLPIRHMKITVTNTVDETVADYDLEVHVAPDGRMWLATDDEEDGSRTPFGRWAAAEAPGWAWTNY